MKSPTAKQIRHARTMLALSQTQAAQIIYHSMRSWQEWEGKRTKMHPALWELWMIRTENMRERARDTW